MAGPSPMPAGIATPQDLAVAMRYGPQTEQALRRSSYLTDALRQLNAEGSQNIHSGGELVAKLLASAILSRGVNRSQDAVTQALRDQQQAEEASLTAGTPLAPGYQPPSPTSPAPDQAPQPPPQQAPQPQAATASPQEPTAPPAASSAAYSPQDLDALIQMAAGEAGGEGPTGVAAVMHVALNRLHSGYGGAKSLYDVIHQPRQFTAIQNGVQPDPRALALAGQVADGVLGGQVPDPTGGAQAFLNPELTQKLYGRIPAWAQGGDGRRIGNHVFFGGGQQVAQNGAQPPAGSPAPAPDGPDAQPVLAGANPFPGQPSAPAQSPAAGTAPVGVTPQAPPAGASPAQVPHQTVMPEEWQTAASLLHNPMTRDLGIQELIKLRLRQASAVPAPDKMMWNQASGRAEPIPGTETTQLPGASPSDAAQRDAFGNVSHAAIPGVQGPVPEGMVWDPTTRAYVHMQTQKQQTFRIPGVLGQWTMGPNGTPVKVADDAITPKDLQTSRDAWRSNDDVKKANEGIAAYNGLTSTLGQMAAGNNGVLSTAAVDSYLRGINPGMGARNTTVNMFLNHLGFSTELKAWVQSNIQGDGYLTPQTLNQMLTVIRQYAGAHSDIAQRMADNDLKALNRYGVPVSPEMLGESMTPFNDPPKVKWLNDEPPTPGGAADPRAAAAAEIARRKAAGKWQGPQ